MSEHELEQPPSSERQRKPWLQQEPGEDRQHGESVRLPGLPGAAQRPGHRLQHEPQGRLLGQCGSGSFFATIKRELVHREPWSTRGVLTRGLAGYIDGWYNPERQHSTLGYLSPIAFERQLNRAA